MLSAPFRAAGKEPPPAATLSAFAALGSLALAVLWFLQGWLSPPDLGEGVTLRSEVRAVQPSRDTAIASVSLQPRSSPSAAVPLEGLVLRGISLGGARGGSVILGSADGGDRVVTVGRELRPGARLKEVGPSFAVIATGAGDVRMELGRSGSISIGAAASDAAGGAVGGANHRSEYRETVDYRLGLQPVRSEGRINGFAIRPDAVLPQLQQAGLRPGDVILAVNGQAFQSEEKVLELSNEIATSRTAEFEFIRQGKMRRASLTVR